MFGGITGSLDFGDKVEDFFGQSVETAKQQILDVANLRDDDMKEWTHRNVDLLITSLRQSDVSLLLDKTPKGIETTLFLITLTARLVDKAGSYVLKDAARVLNAQTTLVRISRGFDDGEAGPTFNGAIDQLQKVADRRGIHIRSLITPLRGNVDKLADSLKQIIAIPFKNKIDVNSMLALDEGIADVNTYINMPLNELTVILKDTVSSGKKGFATIASVIIARMRKIFPVNGMLGNIIDVAGMILSLKDQAGDVIKILMSQVKDLIPELIKMIMSLFDEMVESIKSIFSGVLDTGKDIMSSAGSVVKDIGSALNPFD